MKCSEKTTTAVPALASVLVALLIMTGVTSCRPRSSNKLPDVRQYSDRSAQFNDRLQNLRAGNISSTAQVRELARLYQANRLFDEATKCYTILEARPSELTAQDLYYLSRLDAEKGGAESAVENLRRVAAMAPQYLPSRVLLAESLFKSGSSDEARKVYDDIISRDGGHYLANLGLARIDLQEGRDDRAAERLESLVAHSETASSAAALLSQLLERKGQQERSAALRELSRKRPDPIPDDPWLERLYDYCYDAQLLSLRFESFVFAGQMDKALPLLQRVEALDEKSWVPIFVKGWMLAQAHRAPEAEESFRIALRRGGDPEKIVPQLCTALVAQSKSAEARKNVDEALSSAPNSVALMTVSAQLALKENDIATARRMLERILQQEPYLPSQNFDLAHILWEKGEHDAAAERLIRVAKAYPNDASSRGWLGQYYIEKGDEAKAITLLEAGLRIPDLDQSTAAQLKAELLPVYFKHAQEEEKAGNFAAALETYRKIEVHEPSNAQLKAALANIMMTLGRTDDSIKELKELAQLQPTNPTIPLSEGDILWQAGKRTEAVEAWTTAKGLLRDSDAELRKALEQRLSRATTE